VSGVVASGLVVLVLECAFLWAFLAVLAVASGGVVGAASSGGVFGACSVSGGAVGVMGGVASAGGKGFGAEDGLAGGDWSWGGVDS
jgi:hypothetical protein